MDLSVDVRDVPCDEPFDESDRVQVIPDTSRSGRIQVQVVVRNRNCCCCEGAVSGPLGELRGARSSRGGQSAPRSVPAPAPEPLAVQGDLPVVPVAVPAQPASFGPLSARPVADAPFGAPAPLAATPVSATVAPARVPWWLALAAAPAVLLFGNDSNDICEDDETGNNSGPARACDADATLRAGGRTS